MRIVFLVTGFILSGTAVCLAQGSSEERQACTRDAQHFCRKQLGDDGAVQHCLQQHRARLSKRCQRVFESHGM
jgi:cysteine rich repeat protein